MTSLYGALFNLVVVVVLTQSYFFIGCSSLSFHTFHGIHTAGTFIFIGCLDLSFHGTIPRPLLVLRYHTVRYENQNCIYLGMMTFVVVLVVSTLDLAVWMKTATERKDVCESRTGRGFDTWRPCAARVGCSCCSMLFCAAVVVLIVADLLCVSRQFFSQRNATTLDYDSHVR